MNELERQIMSQTRGLPPADLCEILDFIKSVRHKKRGDAKKLPFVRCSEEDYLKTMERNELLHLENEFANYRKLYPHEK